MRKQAPSSPAPSPCSTPGLHTCSAIEEDRLAGALQNNVPFELRQLAWHFPRDQRRAALRFHAAQCEVGFIRGFVGAINPGHQWPQQAARKERQLEVRRLWFAVRSRNRAGLDGTEAKFPVVVGRNTPVAANPRLNRLVLGVLGMRVLAVRIGLPDFQQGIGNRRAVAVQNASRNYNVFSGHLGGGQRVAIPGRAPNGEVRTHGLRRCRNQRHYSSSGVASRPLKTMSNRYPSAVFGMVLSQSNAEISRFRASSSAVAL